ncbi:MAG TPA: hypothetical protein VLA53_05870 [Nitrosopumilaceae archaeon]|nr:hypothetical protein [Nitrosopumilaceae archaeon]
MISKGRQFGLALAIIFVSSFMPQSLAQPAYDRFYVKGLADETGPFANQNIRILGNEDKITIIRNTLHSMVIVRMNVSISAHCYDAMPTICISGIVYDTKNTDSPDIGDVLRLNIDPSGKKQTVSFLTGERAGSSVSIHSKERNQQSEFENIQKLIFIPEKRDPLTLVNTYENDEMIKAIQKAQEFAITHPTFVFDGIPESLDVNLVSVIQSKSPLYVIQVEFDSEHPGYGNRTGQVLKDVTTHHEMKIMISDNDIGSAIMDGIWDEFNQKWQK